MTSKNSFWASIKENNKRRIWVWVLSALAFILIFPAYTALRINRITMRLTSYIESYGEVRARKMIQESLLSTMYNTIGFSYLIIAFATILAVVAAIQGFSYLYSRKKIDFYQGMPVKRKKRFFVIWLNGISVFILPYLLGLLISIAIAAGNGALDGSVLIEAIAAFMIIICFYLCVYQLAILAVMLTGNVVITCLGFAVFCLYELLARQVLYSFMQLFFRYFSYIGTVDEAPVLSPFSMYIHIANGYKNGTGIDVKYVIGLIGFTAALGVLSYFCYKKRPAEAAGRAMTFYATRPFVKICLSVLVTLCVGLVIADMIGFSPLYSMDGLGYVIFAMVVTAIVSNGLIQVIYEADIWGILHQKRHIVISGILIALIFMIFRYDFFHYDSFIPNPDEVESIAFIPQGYEMVAGYSNSYFDEQGNPLSEQEYVKRNMYISNVQSVCELAEFSMEEYNKLKHDLNTYDEGWSNTILLYRLKNGREVYRQLWINMKDDRAIACLDEIIGSDEFKQGFFLGVASTMEQLMADSRNYTVDAVYGNFVYEKKMSRADVTELLTAYKQDMKNVNFSVLRESVPIGAIKLEFSQRAENGYNEYVTATRSNGMNIYPSYKNCISYLQEKGYYMDYQLNPEDVDRIQIINYNSEINKELQDKQNIVAGAETIGQTEAVAAEVPYGKKGYSGNIDTRVYADYTEASDIEKIAACIYPTEVLNTTWEQGLECAQDYDVVVYFKTDSEMTKNYGVNAYYGFVEAQVPEFVQKDTLYSE